VCVSAGLKALLRKSFNALVTGSRGNARGAELKLGNEAVGIEHVEEAFAPRLGLYGRRRPTLV
jgi:hypothetical protein